MADRGVHSCLAGQRIRQAQRRAGRSTPEPAAGTGAERPIARCVAGDRESFCAARTSESRSSTMTPSETLVPQMNRIQRNALVVGVIALALSVVGLFLDAAHFWQSYLFA